MCWYVWEVINPNAVIKLDLAKKEREKRNVVRVARKGEDVFTMTPRGPHCAFFLFVAWSDR